MLRAASEETANMRTADHNTVPNQGPIEKWNNRKTANYAFVTCTAELRVAVFWIRHFL